MTHHVLALTSVLAFSVQTTACEESGRDAPTPSSGIVFTPDRPGRDPAPPVAPYDGDDPIVLEAQARFATGLDLHVKVIARTCSPTEGVCHNTKEYPDLHTAANFLGTIEAPCNIQAGTREGIFDRCERPGDRFELASDAVASGPIEIGHLRYVPGARPDYSERNPPTAASPGLHVTLADPIATDRRELWTEGRFIRTFVNAAGLVQDIAYQSFGTRWWVLAGGTELVGEVNEWQVDAITRLLDVGVVEGDPNLNGVYGARVGEPVAMIVPGDPETSYLVARVRGLLEGAEVPGTRMPLANQPLSTAEMLALFCFIEGLPGGAPARLDGAIDFASCSYSADPSRLELVADDGAATWSGRIAPLLEVNCGGCHDAESPSGELPLVGDEAFSSLLQASTGRPELERVEPGDPDASYLWLKLTNAPDIEGSPMPTSPLTGWRPLSTAELDDLRAWIENGALRD